MLTCAIVVCHSRYDVLVMATGSYAWVPPIPGCDEYKNVFVYRTIEDCQKIIATAPTCEAAAVIGGGLLGLEGAKACYGAPSRVIYVSETIQQILQRNK